MSGPHHIYSPPPPRQHKSRGAPWAKERQGAPSLANMLAQLPPELLAIVMDKLDALELCRLCATATALRDAEQNRAETRWHGLTLKQWPWASNPTSIVSGLSSWKARYKVMHRRLHSRLARSEPASIDQLNARYEFLLECSSKDMSSVNTVPVAVLPYEAGAADPRMYFGCLQGAPPLRVVGNYIEILVRRRADGAFASFIKMRRDGVPDDEEPVEAVAQHVFRIDDPLPAASWAYDEGINPSIDIPALSNLGSSVVAFRELRCSMMFVKEEAGDEAMTSGTLPVTSWHDTNLDVKIDDEFLKVSQLEMILKHKLFWARE